MQVNLTYNLELINYHVVIMTLLNIYSTRKTPTSRLSTQNPTTCPVTLHTAEAILPDVKLRGKKAKIVEGIFSNAHTINQ
jgi:hypothetical protein